LRAFSILNRVQVQIVQNMKKSPSRLPIKIRVPANFDASSIAQRYRKRTGDIQLLADRLNWFVYQLVSAGQRQDMKKDLEQTGYINLSVEVFDEVFKSRTTTEAVINILDGVVFDRNHSYQTGNYSKGYRLRSEYLLHGTKSVELQSLPMRRYVRAKWAEDEKERKKRLTSVSQLVNCIQSPDLKIDLGKAHGFLEFWAKDLQEKIREQSAKLSPDLIQELCSRALTKVYYQKELLRRIERRDIYVTRDASGQRLHSAYTGLKSPLRSFLTYQGQELVSVDLKASQPYLLTRLLQPDFWKKSGTKVQNPYNLAFLHPDLYKSLSKDRSLDGIIMFTSSAKMQSGSGLHGFTYLNLPWEKDYYQLLMDQAMKDYTGQKKIMSCYRTRGRTKFHNMLLFFDPSISGENSYRVPFGRYFPGVLNLMDAIRETPGIPKKRRGKPVGVAKNNNLPILLQRLESRLILDEVCPAILKDYPGMFLLTIHDSIITVKGQESIVIDYMTRILESRIGTKPGLKVEPLDPSIVIDSWESFIQDEWDEMLSALNSRKRSIGSGSALSDRKILDMLDALSRLGSEPLLWNTLPQLGERKIVSTQYINHNLTTEEDYGQDEEREYQE